MTSESSCSKKAEPGRSLHVAIIMDGNGRWATRRGSPRMEGHRAGVRAARRAVEYALAAGVSRLTLYAFSADNWQRPAPEVRGIFWLLRAFLRLESERMRQRGVRIQIIGRRDRLACNVLEAIEAAEKSTSAGQQLHLRVAVDYSSRAAIVQTVAEASCVSFSMVTPSPDLLGLHIEQSLDASDDVDLLIRTGGEKRLSDFLLWESAYAELIFTDRMWPEFDHVGFAAALTEFAQRDRRYGALSPPQSHLTSLDPAITVQEFQAR